MSYQIRTTAEKKFISRELMTAMKEATHRPSFEDIEITLDAISSENVLYDDIMDSHVRKKQRINTLPPTPPSNSLIKTKTTQWKQPKQLPSWIDLLSESSELCPFMTYDEHSVFSNYSAWFLIPYLLPACANLSSSSIKQCSSMSSFDIME